MSTLIPLEAGEHRIPIRVWGRTLPPGALDQLRRIATQPDVVDHIAAMPDLHVAHGVAVGTVFATLNTIVPSALGGDLGCGVSAVPFAFPAANLARRDLEAILSAMAESIPVADECQRASRDRPPELATPAELSTRALARAAERLIPKHLGTLGGGNHFIELDRDGGGNLWLLVHSGSRGLGQAIAHHHVMAAAAARSGELPGLSLSTPEGRACAADVAWACAFARANRDALVDAATRAVERITAAVPELTHRVDVQHNFVREELHFGARVWVHRKGAIAAAQGERAVIPGSMGTASYLVEGLGEELSFRSASHGAGRVMTRRQARDRIPVQRFVHSMRRVVFDNQRQRSLVEEAPSAYRNIEEVLEDERDLVRSTLRLEPIAVLKG